jgi:hypothetical protein
LCISNYTLLWSLHKFLSLWLPCHRLAYMVVVPFCKLEVRSRPY